jgi:hypothetical protein
LRVILLFIFFIIAFSHPVQAEEKPLFENKMGSCNIKAIANERWKAIQVRVFTDGLVKDVCSIRKDETLKIIKETFSALAKSQDKIVYESLYLGRIIYNEWLSKHLVDRSIKDLNWSTELGQPKPGHKIASVVEKILGDPGIINKINTSLTVGSYRATGFSCEKILVSSPKTKRFEPDWTPVGKRVPFDAMCWLKLSSMN